MVAYSYKMRFVNPIRKGLGLSVVNNFGVEIPDVRPKRQTIRADRKRHARPGEELQHYCGMRTKGCFLIGRARCLSVEPIMIEYDFLSIDVYLNGEGLNVRDLEKFCQADGFSDAADMRQFWFENRHHNPLHNEFNGVLIRWEPLP